MPVSPGHRTMRKHRNIRCSSAQRVTGAPRSQHRRVGPTGRCWAHSPASVMGRGQPTELRQEVGGSTWPLDRADIAVLSGREDPVLQPPTPQTPGQGHRRCLGQHKNGHFSLPTAFVLFIKTGNKLWKNSSFSRVGPLTKTDTF